MIVFNKGKKTTPIKLIANSFVIIQFDQYWMQIHQMGRREEEISHYSIQSQLQARYLFYAILQLRM